MKRFLRNFICLVFTFFVFCSTNCFAENSASFPHWENPKNIRVYIYNNKYSDLMKRAFKEWETATHNQISFLFVTTPERAQDIVAFNEMFSGSEAGVTSAIHKTYYDKSGNVINKKLKVIKILIGENNPHTYKKMSQKEMYVVMLHEIGHSLGLQHTNNTKSIMFPSTKYSNTAVITKEDINTLYSIYNWK